VLTLTPTCLAIRQQLEKNFRGGMVQSWNKFCFAGGIVEISVRLPGESTVAGLWPAFWLMGNLGRALYEVRVRFFFFLVLYLTFGVVVSVVWLMGNLGRALYEVSPVDSRFYSVGAATKAV
jgi:beta-glucanase (GH16 family)